MFSFCGGRIRRFGDRLVPVLPAVVVVAAAADEDDDDDEDDGDDKEEGVWWWSKAALIWVDPSPSRTLLAVGRSTAGEKPHR